MSNTTAFILLVGGICFFLWAATMTLILLGVPHQ